MPRLNPNIRAGFQPIAGYTLRRRLGAGGYGEVWLADAPGGLQKAIKFIFGSADQSQAAGELRSLQRIRQVHHPFILSLERIEIVDSQVIIVTELAESSLLDCFMKHKHRGAPGVARATLLEYLRDTSDALDFLAQKHGLQHLDVKPGNLLLIADRIKVADFGLIKDLQDKSQSLVSGLTPTYSAPEVFDGRPDFRSDQYSLAIVYMEMLTGELPFTGRTTGELARQHISMPPDLEALPPADRPFVARALSKNPLDRYPTCRAFIDQLLKTRAAALPQLSERTPKSKTPTAVTSDSHRNATPTQGPNTCEISARTKIRPAIDPTSLPESWGSPYCLFIGAGKQGNQALCKLFEMSANAAEERLNVDDHAWLAIDTNMDELTDITFGDHACLPSSFAVQIPLHKPSKYRDSSQTSRFQAISRRWLYNIPRTLQTEGVRPLAVLAYLEYYHVIRNRLTHELRRLCEACDNDSACTEPVRIYIFASLHGGTGGGLFSELGLLVRDIMSDLGYRNYRLTATLCASMVTGSSGILPAAAGIAGLSELTQLMQGNHEILLAGDPTKSVAARPFDWVTLVDGGMYGIAEDAHQCALQMAQTAWLDSRTMLSNVLVDSRLESENGDWLRTASSCQLGPTECADHKTIAQCCCDYALYSAGAYLRTVKSRSMESNGSKDTSHDSRGSMVAPLPEQTCNEYATRLLEELGFVTYKSLFSNLGTDNHDEETLSRWVRRLSDSESLRAEQLADDLRIWCQAVQRWVTSRVYTWKQIEQIQLNAIEYIVAFSQDEAEELVEQFAPFTKLLAPPDMMRESVREYLTHFVSACADVLRKFQRSGQALAASFAEVSKELRSNACYEIDSHKFRTAILDPQIQILVGRVDSRLEAYLHVQAQQAASCLLDDNSRPVGEAFTLETLLDAAQQCIQDTVKELGIDTQPEDVDQASQKKLTLSDIGDFLPGLIASGGEFYRFVFSTPDQISNVQQALEESQQLENTTVLPCLGNGFYLLCDANQLNLPQIISTLWRPNNSTFQLAERLRTRIDIDWTPAHTLLEAYHSPISVNLLTSATSHTQDIPCNQSPMPGT
ncbi:MAG: protein kinase [Planctomycetales bacterium]|nr:protein kinase [Planctomycetales bacterium]